MTTDDPTRYVYHGTTADSIDSILEQGLKPRDATDKSNWDENQTPSIPEHVYLTRYFPAYFGVAARDSPSDPIAIFEVDMNRLNKDADIYPDEDFIEQSLRDNRLNVEVPEFVDIDLSGNMRERTEIVRDNIELFRPYWEMSLLALGNISHKSTIPPEAIKRVSVADLPTSVQMMFLDTTISIEVGMFASKKHDLLTQWLMGENVTISEIASASFHGAEVPDGILNQYQNVLDPSSFNVHENPRYNNYEKGDEQLNID